MIHQQFIIKYTVTIKYSSEAQCKSHVLHVRYNFEQLSQLGKQRQTNIKCNKIENDSNEYKLENVFQTRK